MNLLLDTMAIPWWVDDDPRLSTSAREAVADHANEVSIILAQAAGEKMTLVTGASTLRCYGVPVLW